MSRDDLSEWQEPDEPEPRPLMFDGEVQCYHCKEIDLASEMKYDPKRDRYCCLNCLDHLKPKGPDAGS